MVSHTVLMDPSALMALRGHLAKLMALRPTSPPLGAKDRPEFWEEVEACMEHIEGVLPSIDEANEVASNTSSRRSTYSQHSQSSFTFPTTGGCLEDSVCIAEASAPLDPHTSFNSCTSAFDHCKMSSETAVDKHSLMPLPMVLQPLVLINPPSPARGQKVVPVLRDPRSPLEPPAEPFRTSPTILSARAYRLLSSTVVRKHSDANSPRARVCFPQSAPEDDLYCAAYMPKPKFGMSERARSLPAPEIAACLPPCVSASQEISPNRKMKSFRDSLREMVMSSTGFGCDDAGPSCEPTNRSF